MVKCYVPSHFWNCIALYFMVVIGYPHPETLSKSRRSLKTSLSHGPLSHAVMIDALGNAEAEVSVPALADGARGDFAVSVQHASVRALGK